MTDEPKINNDKISITSGGWKFWFVILLFAVAFCDGRDNKDLHDAVIEKINAS